MNVLIACEESQTVCKAFRLKGHRAFSADIQECSGGHPEWHIHGDVIPLLNGNCNFTLQNGEREKQDGRWDLIIAHPPCTHLSVSGARHFEKKRADGRQKAAIEFFVEFLNADCEKVCIENPVNIISGNYIKKFFPELCKKYNLPKKATQNVSPHMFGSKTRKSTNYWLKGLPKLIPTNIVEPDIMSYTYADGRIRTYSADFCVGTGSHSGKARSVTAKGIADAMAEQWG